MSFPALKSTEEFSPSRTVGGFTQADGKFSFSGVVTRAGVAFVFLLAGAALGWVVPILLWPALIVGLVLGLVAAFKRVRNPYMTLGYAAVEGVVVGGLSFLMESWYPGVVTQAVMATLVTFVTVLVLYSFKVIRATPKLTRFFIVAAVAYLLFGLLNIILMLTGVTTGMFGLYSDLGWLGIAIGVLGVLLASYSLLSDFTYIGYAVDNQVDETWEWFAAFSLIGSLVWLYIEWLRIMALFARN